MRGVAAMAAAILMAFGSMAFGSMAFGLMAFGAMSAVRAAPAQSDNLKEVRDQLTALGTQIEQVDAKLADVGQQRSQLQAKVDAYAKAIEGRGPAAQRLHERDAELAARRRQLEAEHQAAAELCSRKVAEPEYKALVAKCEAAGAAYRQHAAALQREYDKVVAAHAQYQAEMKQLESEHQVLEQQREAVQQAQSSLSAERARLVNAFNGARDRLIALTDKPDNSARP